MKSSPQISVMTGFSSVLAGLALSVASLLLLGQLPETPAGEPWYASPAFFPVLAIGLVVLGALGQLWVRMRSRTDEGDQQEEVDDEVDASSTDPRLALLAIAGLPVYLGLIALLGFGLATFLLVLGGARLCGLHRRTAWLVGLGLSLTLYGIFSLVFKVGLPTPLLLEWVTGGW